MSEMNTTDRVILIVKHRNGLHVRTAFRVDKLHEAQEAADTAAALTSVAGVEVDFIRDYKGPRTTRVWV